MQAWRVDRLGEPRSVLELVDVEEPVAGPGQIVVDVLAAPANFPDVLLCRGEYQVKPPLPFTPGVELCGRVVALGEGVDTVGIGERVIGSPNLPLGAFAERTVMQASNAFPAPAALADAEASALFIGYQTGWFALHRRTTLRAGETLLVHAAAGGVGSAAVQLGKAAGATVIGVVGGAQKAEYCRNLGADLVIDRHVDDFVPIVKEFTGGRGVDVVYDPVGGEAYEKSTKCIAFEGRILVIGFAGGTIPRPGLNHALIKNYSIIGLHWGLYQHHDAAAIRLCHDELTALAESGAIAPLIGERLPFAQVPEGLGRLGDGSTVGRVVFEP
ncbi:NADPH:quinone oxidoreductase family protein [Rhodococcus triatomae]|uniref:NADPH2:quinone reductase n=1 Tax=Rhodococcus triatomae TaxID=300028 RepID=A0A1G8JKR2_9NOCA|nr:NADPH:quinone oxidoreductase family protein [Rhodococcus triatomae]QNG19696.1 NADPH:quinone oxidoreductase family protein [Rhodococcus triatomae]QNG24389.1 NADPH:quinone oxidoreductase family protein [Rhodococcus triatomae]SDI31671.1 NADPH2:quinone reductase [Rhodococcus triatomae]